MGTGASTATVRPEGGSGNVEQIVHSFMADQASKRAKTYLMNKTDNEDVLEDLPMVDSPVVTGKRLVQSDRGPSREEQEFPATKPMLSSSLSVDSYSTIRGITSSKSLRQIALRSHSRQSNSYLSTKDLLASSGLLFSRKSGENIAISSSSSKASNTSAREQALEANEEDLQGSEAHGPVIKNSEQKRRVRPNLQISISENKIQDDIDWIQVEDEDGEEEEEKSTKQRPTLSLDGNVPLQSYSLTKSGTIIVDGFQGAIGKGGIRATGEEGDAIPLQDRLVFLCRLGAGASGVVYKALDLRDMRIVALKMIPMFERGKRRQMVRELSALFQLLHQKKVDKQNKEAMEAEAVFMGRSPQAAEQGGEGPVIEPRAFIVDFYDAFSNIDDGGVALMMEYMDGGSLQDIVLEGGVDEEPTLASIAQQGLIGLAFLHRCSQLHRDLKPGNFLISKKGEVKIADLGILRQMDDPPGLEDGKATPAVGERKDDEAIPRVQTFVGTATYMSPERIDGQEYSYPSDVWSFGLSLLTVALGKLPIDTDGGYWSILHSIRDEKPPNVPEDDERFSSEFRDFISCCCKTLPEDRLTAEQLLSHPFLQAAHAGAAIGGELERGKAELSEILDATYAHIERRRSEITKERAEQAEQGASEKGATSDSWPVFSEILTVKTHALLHNMFFPKEDEKGEVLFTLAKQLDLPTAVLREEITLFIESTKSVKVKTPKVPPPESTSIQATPKASHGSNRR